MVGSGLGCMRSKCLLTFPCCCAIQVASDASSEGPVENPLLEGGGTPEERQASFLELALCLAAGLPDTALDPLFVVRPTAP